MRETPKTDAAWSAFCIDETSESGDPWSLASDLERELAAALNEISGLKEAVDLAQSEWNEARSDSEAYARELGEAREQRDKARAALINIREGIINEEKNGLWEADIIISIIDRALSPDKYCCPICQQEDCNPKYY